MVVKKVKYFITRFYPDARGYFELPEGSIVTQLSEDKVNTYVEALVPIGS